MNTWFYWFSDKYCGSMNFCRKIMANGNSGRRLSDSSITKQTMAKENIWTKFHFNATSKRVLECAANVVFYLFHWESLTVSLESAATSPFASSMWNFSATSIQAIIIHICRFYEGFQRKYHGNSPDIHHLIKHCWHLGIFLVPGWLYLWPENRFKTINTDMESMSYLIWVSYLDQVIAVKPLTIKWNKMLLNEGTSEIMV